jgi:hypothetical protein
MLDRPVDFLAICGVNHWDACRLQAWVHFDWTASETASPREQVGGGQEQTDLTDQLEQQAFRSNRVFAHA